MTKSIFKITLLLFASCRCSTEYNSLADNSADTTIQATAHMWQGQYEYLSIDLEIKRTDSLFVKDIQITPTIKDNNNFPALLQYEMYSYYLEPDGKYKGSMFWKTFSAKQFALLPAYNRQTNKDDYYIKYKAVYHSDNSINFEKFNADIIVTLSNQNAQEIKHTRKFVFSGERNCRFSVH